MSKERAETRIEAELSDRREIPDSSGSRSIEVDIPRSGLDIDDVLEIDYVDDVIAEGDKFRVYCSTE